MKPLTMTPEEIRRAERVLSGGTWFITFGAVLFSVLTVTPLVAGVTPAKWHWTAPILPLVVDSAVVIVIRLETTVSRLGGEAGRWPAVLRWLTGLFTLALNIGWSALKGDAVGIGVHAVAPMLLIATAEAGRAYRKAITVALDRIAREQQAERDRERSEQQAREQRARDERDRERLAREQAERDTRDHAAALEQQRADREAQSLREQREHEARMEAERFERERVQQAEERAHQEAREARERADQERREQQARAERERLARAQQAERAERERRAAAALNTAPEQPAVNAQPTVQTEAREQMEAGDAKAFIDSNPDMSVRQLAAATGWSVGWVTTYRKSLQAA